MGVSARGGLCNIQVTLFILILPCYWSLSTPCGGKISLILYLMLIDGWIPDIP